MVDVDPETLPLPPLVTGRRIVGCTFDMLWRPQAFLADMAAVHGPVFRLKGPGLRMTVLAGHEGREMARLDEKSGMHRRGPFRAFENEAGMDIFGVQGHAHKMLRELARVPYARQVAAAFLPDIMAMVDARAARWQPGHKLSLFDISSELSIHAAMTMMTPMDLHGSTDDLITWANAVMYVVTGSRPHLTFRSRRYRRAKKAACDAIDEAITRHAAGDFAQLGRTYMIDAARDARNSEGGAMDAEAIRSVCTYALNGTYVYMGRVICYMLYELIRNRTLLAKVQAEVDAAFREGTPDPSVFRRMPYLRGTYLEALRYYVLLPGLAYKTGETVEAGGFRIPAEELVLISPVASHFADDVYANPYAFEAERCMRPRSEHLKRGAYSPFGMGKRVCTAAGMVEIITLGVVSALLRRVDLRLQQSTYTMKLRIKPLIAPHDGIPVHVVAQRSQDTAVDPEALAEIPDYTSPIEENRSPGELPDLEAETVEAGTVIIEQGAPAVRFYMIREGEAVVTQTCPGTGATHTLATLGPGDHFGETGLLHDAARNATVTAVTACRLLVVPGDAFRTLVLDRDLTGSELSHMVQQAFMKRALAKALPALSEDKLASCATGGRLRDVPPGEACVTEGDPSDHFYVLVAGRMAVEKAAAAEPVAHLGPGEFFGALGVLQRQPRSATVRAEGPCTVLEFPRERLRVLLAGETGAQRDLGSTVCNRLMAGLLDGEGA